MELRRDSLFGIIDQICFDQFVEAQLLRLPDVRDVVTVLFVVQLLAPRTRSQFILQEINITVL